MTLTSSIFGFFGGGFALGFILSALFIDVFTLFIFLFISKPKYKPLPSDQGLTIIIPAYNEEKNISKVIASAFNQTRPPKRVYVVDDNSKDNTAQVCMQLRKTYPNLHVFKNKENKGKAYNVSNVLHTQKIDDFVIVLDADTFLSPTYLEEITKPFSNKRTVIVTGFSSPVKLPNLMGRLIYHGATFQYQFFLFRKKAQSYRNAISVITGDSAAYRTSFLKSVGGLPQGTQTEDMDVTWIALEKGYRVVFQPRAHAKSIDAGTFKGHWKQITRWYAGGYQCLVRHGSRVHKAPRLLYTTLIPTFLDATLYSVTFISAFVMLFFVPSFSLGFYLGDLFFTLIAIAYVDWRRIIYLPNIYFLKFVWSAAWLHITVKTLYEVIFLGKTNWSGKWNRDSFYAKTKK